MTELAASANEPAYMTKLGLRAGPFSQSVTPDVFFAAGQAGHRLNLLLHLLRASDKIVNIVADEGLGKSTILQQLVQRAGDEMRLCYIDAQQSLDIHAVLGTCLVAFGVSSQDIATAPDPIAVLMQRLAQLKQLNISPILLIDNADVMSAELRDVLAQWLSPQGEQGPALQAVLASESPYAFHSEIDNHVQSVNLPALPERELAAYLLYRLRQVGFQGDMPFSDKDLKRIYQHSQGVPAKVNQLAHQQLLGISPQSSFWTMAWAQLLQRWAGVGIIVVSIMLLLIYQETINGWFAAQPDSESEQDVLQVIEADDTLPLIVAEEQQQREELAALLSDIPEYDDDVDVDAKQTPIAPVPTLIVQTPQAAPEGVSDIVLDTESPTPSYQQKAWVLAQDEQHYTFQLMGSWEREEVYDFIDTYQLTGDVAVFESMRNGKVWHVLLYGQFESKQAAIKASEAWPEPLNTVPSWLRRFDSVHTQIKNKAVIE